MTSPALVLLLFQVAGDVVARDLGLPLPGFVVGILLLGLVFAGEVRRHRP
jgi:putative effector of murein hydrolase LrgA (UPF0299 family)